MTTTNQPIHLENDSDIRIIRDTRGFYEFRINGNSNAVSYKTAEAAFSDALDVVQWMRETGATRPPLAFSVDGVYTNRIPDALGLTAI